jgi:hypothetical protein
MAALMGRTKDDRRYIGVCDDRKKQSDSVRVQYSA